MSVKNRSEIDKKYQWDISVIIKDDAEFEKLFKAVQDGMKDAQKYKGKLKDKSQLLKCLNLTNDLSHMLERIYVYSKMHQDEDAKVSKYVALTQRAGALMANMGAALSFITPELSAMDEKYLNELIADKDFADFDRDISSIIRKKKHTLSDAEEMILAQGGQMYSSYNDIFFMLADADLVYPMTPDGKGGKVQLSHGTYGLMLSNPDQNIRRKAFKNYYKPYKQHINTFASVYSSSVKKDWFLAKVRKYKSCVESSLFNEEIDERVYSNLIKGVSNNIKYLHEYIALRKQISGLEKLHMHDLHFPLYENASIELEYEDAYELVKKGLAPLGKDYAKLLDEAYKNSWIDVYENSGKRSGAYSWGAYGSHPFVLLNYTKTTSDVFTLAHELGHAMHSYYSDANNTYNKAGYPIFLAEIASTANEVLLLKHIISTTKDVKIKKYLLSYYLDMFRTTLFRQTMFSEFEQLSHAAIENNKPLTVDSMNAMYLKLNKKYYGKSVIHDKEIAYEWTRISHFYRSFYVYKYATGITSAIVLATAMIEQGEPAIKRYKKFLSSGGSQPPLDILKEAGVDLTTTQPFDIAMKAFKDTLDELKSLS